MCTNVSALHAQRGLARYVLSRAPGIPVHDAFQPADWIKAWSARTLRRHVAAQFRLKGCLRMLFAAQGLFGQTRGGVFK